MPHVACAERKSLQPHRNGGLPVLSLAAQRGRRLRGERDSVARAKTSGAVIGPQRLVRLISSNQPPAARSKRQTPSINEEVLMKARDVMVSPVITGGENETARD